MPISKLSQTDICQRLGIRYPIFGFSHSVAWCREETTVDDIMARLVNEADAALDTLPR